MPVVVNLPVDPFHRPLTSRLIRYTQARRFGRSCQQRSFSRCSLRRLMISPAPVRSWDQSGDDVGWGLCSGTRPLGKLDTGLLLTEDESQGQFIGEIRWAQLDLDIEDHDHLLTPEECCCIAMMRQ